MKSLCLFLVCLWLWFGNPHSGYAMVRTLEEAPDRVLVQSRQQLKDSQRSVWQVVLFARHQQLQLRLVGFPDRYHFRPGAPLVLETISGAKLLAEDSFPQRDQVPNVGQFNLLPLVPKLPQDQRLILTLPLEESDLQLVVPGAIIVEWQSVIQQQEKL